MNRTFERSKSIRREDPHRPRILCIDDDAQMRNLLRLCMKGMGMEVLRAPSGRDGVRLARQNPPEVIISDWSMNGGDGALVLRRLRACPDTREVPVIVISGKRTAEMDQLGVDAFLQKPFSYDELRNVIHRFVKLPR